MCLFVVEYFFFLEMSELSVNKKTIIMKHRRLNHEEFKLEIRFLFVDFSLTEEY